MSSPAAVCCIAFLLLQIPVAAETPATVAEQMSTEEHLATPGWWPRKGDAQQKEYVGAAVCGECHSELFAGQQQHSMSHTSSPSPVEIGPRQPVHFAIGSTQYSIGPEGKALVYNVRHGTQSFSAPLVWVFGSGRHGQTYLFRRDQDWWETRMTIFKGTDPGVTPGEPEAPSTSLTEALGRRISDQELPQCFGCHATAAVTDNKFDPASAMPGVSCEGCHGPGASHVSMARSGLGTIPGMIFNPAVLSPPASLDFCGSCHHTWWDVVQMPDKSVNILRLPAYRLEQSRCWGNGDARITCVACHNPHKPLVKTSADYDQKCLSCHVQSAVLTPTQDHPGRGCPVSTSNCTSCHMPNYELPQMRSRFTDHRIRIVRGPDDIPN